MIVSDGLSFCLPCKRGLHPSCKAITMGDPTFCQCLHSQKGSSEQPTEQLSSTNSSSLPDLSDTPSLFSVDEPDEEIRVRSRRSKPDSALKDQQSTGRKRAAKLYPLDKEADCEWVNSSSCGGGVSISGCGVRVKSDGIKTTPGKQQSRHHGPDYNTLNNDPGNVHRICHSCHNAWHAVNDPQKDENYLKLYGVKPSKEALSNAAKEMRSGGPATKGSDSSG